MTIESQNQQLHLQHRKYTEKRKHIVIVVCAALIAISFSVAGILNILDVITEPWINLFTFILIPVIAIAVSFFQIYFSNTSHSKSPGILKTSHLVSSHSFTDPVFLLNEPLTDLCEFYGRFSERETLLNRTYNGASTSVIGPHKVGKTWLMEYLLLAASIQLGSRFQFSRLYAGASRCKTVSGFIDAAIEGFGTPPYRETNGLARLEKAVKDLKSKNVVPILCIDEFESLNNQQEFTLDFFRGLRALTQRFGFVLVVISKYPLIEVVGKDIETSGFFNVFEQLTLEPFNIEEAQSFVREKSIKAAFTGQESDSLLKYGQDNNKQWFPMRLQLAGAMLMQEKLESYYAPDDPKYWQSFAQRLEDKYRELVGR